MKENSIDTTKSNELLKSSGSEEFDRKRFKKCLNELQELLSKTNMSETIKNNENENDEEKTSNNASSFSSFSFDDFNSSSSSSLVSLNAGETADNDL